MNGAIFIKTLRDGYKSILGWGLVLGMFGFLTVLLYPTVRDFEGLEALLDSMPPALKALTGSAEDFASLEGMLATKFFSMGPLVLAVYAVQFAATGITGEEKRGTMDLLMSTPVTRRQVIAEKFLGFVVSLFVVLLLSFLGVMAGTLFTPDIDMSPVRIFEATANLAPIAMTFGALTFLLSVTTPPRISGGMVAVGAAVAFYMLYLLGRMSSVLEPLQVVNPFYYHGMRTIFDGMNWGNVLVLLVASGALFGATLYSFQRRDLNV